jgi:hypothetical protein
MVSAMSGIFVPAIYARETASWAAQGIGQDWVNLLIVGPALLVAAWRAASGDRRAQLVVGGLLLYTAYSFAIYAIATHFNMLFLVYCAVLGGSTFALVDLVVVLTAAAHGRWFDADAPLRLAAATLFSIAGLFGALWLGSIVPSLVTGREPAALAETGLAANPVQVLDLALLLPAMVVVGVALRRWRPWAQVLAPILLGFGVIMALAIGGMILTMYIRGLSLDIVPSIAMAVVAVGSAFVLDALLRHLRSSVRI